MKILLFDNYHNIQIKQAVKVIHKVEWIKIYIFPYWFFLLKFTVINLSTFLVLFFLSWYWEFLRRSETKIKISKYSLCSFCLQFDMIDDFFSPNGPRKLIFFYQTSARVSISPPPMSNFFMGKLDNCPESKI